MIYFSRLFFSEYAAYDTDEVVCEYTTPGTYDISLNGPGLYYIELVGAGGGGSMATAAGAWSHMAGGGSGAAFVGEIILKKGDYSIIVGAAGNGINTNPTAQDPTPGRTAESGGDTKITINNELIISCDGGTGGYAYVNGGITGGGGSTGGTGGTITNNAIIKTTTLSRVGNDGATGSTDPAFASVYGGDSVYNDYGKGGDATGNYTAYPGGNGYFKLTYKGLR